MNQTSRTILISSSTHLFNELDFKLKFDSLGSRTKFNESIIESNLKLFSNWFGSLSALLERDKRTWGKNMWLPVYCYQKGLRCIAIRMCVTSSSQTYLNKSRNVVQ